MAGFIIPPNPILRDMFGLNDERLTTTVENKVFEHFILESYRQVNFQKSNSAVLGC
jgi:hypothetical protein